MQLIDDIEVQIRAATARRDYFLDLIGGCAWLLTKRVQFLIKLQSLQRFVERCMVHKKPLFPELLNLKNAKPANPLPKLFADSANCGLFLNG